MAAIDDMRTSIPKSEDFSSRNPADANSLESKLCETPGCGKPANLRCPTCSKLNLTDSFFCSQACFKGSWAEHKKVHTKDISSNGPLDAWPDFRFTGPLRPWKQTPRRKVPLNIVRPDYADDPEGRSRSEEGVKSKGSTTIQIWTKEDKERARVAGRLGREVLDECAKAVQAGITADEIDRIAHEACIERECYPSPLNYYSFPKSCCISVNEVICHGIPDLRPLQNGDIVNIDISVYHRGWHSDLNETIYVGEVDSDTQRLVTCAYECLEKAIESVKPGVRYRDVGDVITKHAQSKGCSVVRAYCGHGCHELFHGPPNVPHYEKNKAIGVMRPGHIFTIEPMINLGTWQEVTWPDDWTSVTRDGKRSAQFEHTLLVLDPSESSGATCEVLTRNLGNDNRPWFMRK